jgi:hypothetical protein
MELFQDNFVTRSSSSNNNSNSSIVDDDDEDDQRWKACSLHVKRHVRPVLTKITTCPQTVTWPSIIRFHKNASWVLRCYVSADMTKLTVALLQTIRCECPQQDMATLLDVSSFAWTCECLLSPSDNAEQNIVHFLISNFRRVLYVVCFLLGDSPAPEFL